METNEVINNPTASPRTVRSNWLVFSWNQISQASRVLLVLSLSVAIIQIIATITSLCLGKNESCGKPLQSYLIVYVIRVALSFPLLIYQHLFKRRPRRSRRSYNNHNATTNSEDGENNNSNNNNSNQSESVTNDNDNNDETITTSDPVTTSSTTATASTDTAPSSSYSTTSSTNIGNRIQWADRIKSLLDLSAILLFIIGNYLAFSSSSCARQAPTLFYTVLAWILLGYMIVLVPVFICASVIFCLPCVLVAIRTFNVNVSNVIVGGSKEEIAKIPVFRYKAPDENDTASTVSNGHFSTHTSTSQQSKKKESSIHTIASTKARKARRYFYGLFNRQHGKNNDDSEQGKKYTILTITRQEDAVCSICLSDYENEDLICKLWCNHHYHKNCVQEWLELNSKCPLCKRDFRGKDHDSNDEEEED